MKSIICLLLVSLSMNSFSKEIIWNFEENKNLRASITKNPIYIKRFLRLSKINREYLGRGISPFYKFNNKTYKNYKTYSGTCYRLEIQTNSSIAKKVNCTDAKYIANIDGQVFEQLSDLTDMEDYSFLINEDIASHEMNASHFQAWQIAQSEELPTPFTRIKVDLSKNQKFEIKKKRLQIVTNVLLSRDAYAFLSPRTQTVNQVLKVEPKKGDFIFKKGHQFFLYKRYQPTPLNFRSLSDNSLYPDYLNSIEALLLQFPNDKRCLRDDLLDQSPYDCDFLLYKNKSFATYKSFNGILVDTDKKTIDLL